MGDKNDAWLRKPFDGYAIFHCIYAIPYDAVPLTISHTLRHRLYDIIKMRSLCDSELEIIARFLFEHVTVIYHSMCALRVHASECTMNGARSKATTMYGIAVPFSSSTAICKSFLSNFHYIL